jgi:hypothetical protein
MGEVRETQHHIGTAKDKQYLSSERFRELDDGYDHCGRMLEKLHQSLSEWKGSTRTGKLVREARTGYTTDSETGWPAAVEITTKIDAEAE